ncbi:MAG: hypothetical protein J5940_01280 [Clostridia bacterium]|nr:hypothetical protein [Clostridia bacterium]
MTKRFIILALSFLILLSASSCGKTVLSTDIADDDFRQENRLLFPISEEECGHAEFYYIPAGQVDKNYSSEEYHYCYCVNPNCSFEGIITPHSEQKIIKDIMPSAEYFSGGFYHEVIYECSDCFQTGRILSKCKNNRSNCNECYSQLIKSGSYYSIEELRSIVGELVSGGTEN